MKKLISPLLLLVLISVASFAVPTVRTVSNDPAHPAQYPDVGAAIAASVAGDIVYVQGTNFIYPDFVVDKQLDIVGAGYNSNNAFGFSTKVNYAYIISTASGSSISGFQIIQTLSGYQNGVSACASNVTIFRNSIGTISAYNSYNSSVASNWTIKNNIIGGISGGSGGTSGKQHTNILISNNIFTSYPGVAGFSSATVLIDHNLFISPSGGGAYALNGLDYVTVSNNIFNSGTATLMQSVEYCTFNNNVSNVGNISAVAPTNSFVSNFNTEAAGTNVIGTGASFVNATTTFSYTSDYRLSAGHNTASDGTDVGIYGGSYPFPSGGASGSGYDTSPLPKIPQITNLTINNPSVPSNQNLSVRVQATVNN